ncbi:uncharacterized protein LOC118347690 [Juglans regia]|uniref:Uncharacterized protein LOC118347690 n=1 Tax=Juglans regia TaxID=51240 RepID=A0A6P9E672_JUGRE|nr:uncharacterized protein LOC118347690 [Juglans regia]
MAEDITNLWRSFSLTNTEQDGVVVTNEELHPTLSKGQFGLIGKVVAEQRINREGFKSTMEKVWKFVQDLTITEAGDNLFIFEFGSHGDLYPVKWVVRVKVHVVSWAVICNAPIRANRKNHNKLVSEPRSCNMAEGTRLSQLVEAVTTIHGETASLKEAQKRQEALIEGVLQQLNNLASSYDSLAQQFFTYCQTSEDHKLQIASFHIEGKALTWYYWLMESSPAANWDDFLVALRIKFGPSAYEDLVGAFTKLRQTGTVEEYQTAFEILSNKITGVSEEFRISTFLSGLRDELRIIVTMFKPNTLSAAFGLARLQEEEVGRKQYPYRNPHSQNSPHPNTHKPAPLRLLGPNPIPRLPAPPPPDSQPNPNVPKRYHFPIKRLNPSQMQERRDKGLCYNCDQKYQIGHRCNWPKLYLLEVLELGGGDYEEEEGEETYAQGDMGVDPTTQQAELLVISLHAIAGAPSPKTMRLVGKIGKNPVTVLIDTGSTHSFIDMNVARKIRLPVEESHLAVQVANGATFPCHSCCKAVLLRLQSCDILANLYLLTLGGCDVVLGVDWLRSLGTIQWNFTNLSMRFHVEGQQLLFQGLKPPENSLEEELKLNKNTLAEGRGIWLQLMEAGNSKGKAPVDPALQVVLDNFQIVFAEPSGLPPPRSHDHQIQLQEAAKPTCVRPYRYPYYQKEEIEKLVREMLKARIIQPSQSPYSSPVLLVRKADGSWRMCIDYRALNKDTIKDKFPIPNIDELLDELHGAELFSKLDLRSGYHQIRMSPEDVPKTAFRLTGYYRKFVKGYGSIAAPLTALLKNNSFSWNEEATQAFTALKVAMVRIDQQALKHLLEQKVGTPFQQKWVAKLLGFDFSVEYRSGKENRAADALSRLPTENDGFDPQESLAICGEAKAISVIKATWWEGLQQAYNQDPQLQQLISRCH